MPSSSPPSLRTSPGWQGNLPVWGSCRGTTPTERGSLPLLHFCPVLHQGVCGIQESRSGSLGARSCGSFTRTIRISSGFIKVHTGWHNSHTIDSPLLPVMHWPTFLQLLMSREDERSQTWRAYLLSLGASLHNLNHYTSLSAAIPVWRIDSPGRCLYIPSGIFYHPAAPISSLLPGGAHSPPLTPPMPRRVCCITEL